MGRPALQRQQSPLPTPKNSELDSPSVLQSDLAAPIQEATTSKLEATPSLTDRQPEQSAITDDEVRHRAYQLYLQRGAVPGYEVEDWLQAQRELLAQRERLTR